jgi:hypothetical protein
MSAPSLDVLLTVGDVEPDVVSLATGGPGESTVTVLFPLDGSTVSLTFTADRFLAFVERLRQFAEGLPKPS